MQSRKKQQGLTFISWMVILIVVGFMVMIALKITPVYLEHYAIKASLESLKNEPFISRKPSSDIRKLLNRRLDMNSIKLSKDKVLIERRGGVTTITVKYDVIKPLISNISLIIAFDDSIELIPN